MNKSIESMFPAGCNRQCQRCQLWKQCQIPFREIFSNAGTSMSLLADKEIILTNNATLKLIGLTRMEQILGRQPVDFSPPFQPCDTSSALKMEKMIALAHKQGSCRFEWLIQSNDGSPIPIHVNLISMSMAGEYVLLALADNNEKNIQASQEVELFVDLVEQLFNFVYQLNNKIADNQHINWPDMVTPFLVTMIDQANLKGIMRISTPQHTVELLLQLGFDLHEKLRNIPSDQANIEVNKALAITTYLQCIERTLNMEEGTITLSAKMYKLAKDAFSLA